MSSSICIAELIKSQIPRCCIISFLNKIDSKHLLECLHYSKVYCGSERKKKIHLIEMIVYGNICNKIIDIS